MPLARRARHVKHGDTRTPIRCMNEDTDFDMEGEGRVFTCNTTLTPVWMQGAAIFLPKDNFGGLVQGLSPERSPRGTVHVIDFSARQPPFSGRVGSMARPPTGGCCATSHRRPVCDAAPARQRLRPPY
jgi:hypothetical protein